MACTVLHVCWAVLCVCVCVCVCVSQVSVALIVTDVDTSSTWLKQMSRVVWAQYQPGDTRVFYSYSGNPGYLTGFPLLVGYNRHTRTHTCIHTRGSTHRGTHKDIHRGTHI